MGNNKTVIAPLGGWQQTLNNHREWVKGWMADELLDFDGEWQAKLNLICAVAPHLETTNVAGWQALGVVFGDALALALGLSWGEITDEYGTDPCLVLDASTNAVLFPLTMLSKRVEKGESLDRATILNLFSTVLNSAQEHMSH